MKKLCKTLLAVTLTLALCVLTACNIDLSHKHYLNSYGVCNSCQKDVSVLLTKTGGQYVSTDIQTDVYCDTIVRFVGDNENGIRVSVTASENVPVGNGTLYSQTTAYYTQTTGATPLVWQGNIESGKMYYLRIQTTGHGTLKVTITENI